MKEHTLRKKQFLPITLGEAWDFFSSPANLGRITPARMNFKIVEKSGGDRMFRGQLIKYKITVLPLCRVTWVTEITEVRENFQFTDEQRQGPYAQWRHTHTFEKVGNGIEMTDEVRYALPMGVLGRLAHSLFVEREVNRIFDYRYRVLEQYFGRS